MGLITGRYGVAIAWGFLAGDPRITAPKVPGKKHVTNFSLAYDKAQNPEGKWFSKYLNVTAFGRTSEHFAQYLEKGDYVLVVGRYSRDDYNSQRTGEDAYKLNADFIATQQFVTELAAAQNDTTAHPTPVSEAEETQAPQVSPETAKSPAERLGERMQRYGAQPAPRPAFEDYADEYGLDDGDLPF